MSEATDRVGLRGLEHATGTGERVFIRHPLPQDRDEFLHVLRRSRAFHEPWNPRPPAGVDAYADDAFDRLIATARTENRARFLVCLTTTGEIVGAVNFGEIIRGVLQQAFCGYWVDVHRQGNGYMTEAIPLALHFAFDELGLHRIEANIQPHNRASISLIRRCGFRKEGFSPRYLKIDGCWCDHERWAMTVEDWRGRSD